MIKMTKKGHVRRTAGEEEAQESGPWTQEQDTRDISDNLICRPGRQVMKEKKQSYS